MTKSPESAEMYLETILVLKRQSPSVHAVQVAAELGYSRASVSRGVNLLVKKGDLVVTPDGEINFTPAGQAKADAIYERHTMLTALFEKMGADTQLAARNACRIEHVIDPELCTIIKKYLAR